MNALYSLVLTSGTKEALFAALWLALDETPGTFADVDFASLRATAARFGVALSESQIRKRVKELEKLDVLAVVPRRERGRFDLLVYQPAPSKVANEPKPEPATPLFDAAFGKGVESFAKPTVATKPTVPVFAAVSETETETAAALETVESIRDRSRLTPFRCIELERVQTPEFATCAASPFAVEATENCVETPNRFAIERDRSRLAKPESESREPVAAPLEEINIKNKTINKPAKDFNRETQAGPEARSVADIRSLVDFESPKVAALRREIAEAVWEPTVHPDLIDRLTAAVVLRVGGATRSTVFALIREARDAKSLFERSNGRAGKRTIWETAALRTKRLFENAGWVWSPTRFADEPRPFDVRRQARTLERVAPPEETTATTENAETLSVEELATTAAGFEPSELDLPFADFSRLVARRRGIVDACESRGVALEIRNALRELAKRELATA